VIDAVITPIATLEIVGGESGTAADLQKIGGVWGAGVAHGLKQPELASLTMSGQEVLPRVGVRDAIEEFAITMRAI
jgi:hypothetical protein